MLAYAIDVWVLLHAADGLNVINSLGLKQQILVFININGGPYLL